MPTRRRLVRAAGGMLGPTAVGALVSGAAGCLDGTSRGVADVYVRNETGTAVTVTVRVTYLDDGEVALSETVTLDPGDRRKYNNEVVMETTARVEVALDDGTEASYRWDVQGSLHAVVTADGVRFEPEA